MWKKLSSRTLSVVALVALAVVVGASIADAIRQDGLGPIWLVGWIPAILVGAFYRPRSGESCFGRVGRRSRA